MIQATVIRDSISPAGIRLTTMELVYPRFIHAEFMTHRVFSRNASSSRAIPTAKLIEMVRDTPIEPAHWGKNQKGMQAREELDEADRGYVRGLWRAAAHDAAWYAEKMLERGAHKQVVNRILEPFLPIRVVVTATDFANFFALRRHADAQPEIQALANAMWEAREASTPKALAISQWHLPYIEEDDELQVAWATPNSWPGAPERIERLIKVSVARCARTSYRTHDGRRSTVEEDLALYDRLLAGELKHASPAEHQAHPDWILGHDSRGEPIWAFAGEHGNLRGWRQWRKRIPGECVHG